VLVDIMFVLDQLVTHLLLQIGAPTTQMANRSMASCTMKPVRIVLDPHIKGCGDSTFLIVAAHMQVPVRATIGEPVNQRRISIKPEDDVFVLGEQRIVIGFAQTVRMFACRLETHEIDDIYHADFQIRQVRAQDRNRRQNFQRMRVLAAGHNNVRPSILIVGGPLPDSDTLSAVDNGRIHIKPLRQSMFAGHDHADVVLASQAMVSER